MFSHGKRKKITAAQTAIMIDFMEKHPNVANHSSGNQYSSTKINNNWREVGSLLNSIPGARKNWKAWRKTFSDIKSRTKKKRDENLKSVAGTRGGHSQYVPLKPIEERILQLIEGETQITDTSKFPKLLFPEPEDAIPAAPVVSPKEEPSKSPSPSPEAECDSFTFVTGKKEAFAELVSLEEKKLQVRSDYYRAKLDIMEQTSKAYARIADALEAIAKRW